MGLSSHLRLHQVWSVASQPIMMSPHINCLSSEDNFLAFFFKSDVSSPGRCWKSSVRDRSDLLSRMEERHASPSSGRDLSSFVRTSSTENTTRAKNIGGSVKGNFFSDRNRYWTGVRYGRVWYEESSRVVLHLPLFVVESTTNNFC